MGWKMVPISLVDCAVSSSSNLIGRLFDFHFHIVAPIGHKPAVGPIERMKSIKFDLYVTGGSIDTRSEDQDNVPNSTVTLALSRELSPEPKISWQTYLPVLAFRFLIRVLHVLPYRSVYTLCTIVCTCLYDRPKCCRCGSSTTCSRV
jgi:hypothetical protein